MPSDVVVLKRQLGLWSCVGMVIGPIIGSGIFISPKGILQNTGGSVGWALMIWTACGVMSMLGALCMAELSTTFPRSGGDFMYIMIGFNKMLAFLRVFTFVAIVRPASAAVVSMTMGNYLLAVFRDDCCMTDETGEIVVKLLAACMLCVIFALNVYSVPTTYRLQVVLSAAKVLGLVLIIFLGFIRICQGHTSNFENAFKSDNLDIGNIPLAFYSGLFAYAGWHFLPQVTEEVERPSRNIPLAIIISMTIVTIIYILANVAYFTVLSPEELLTSKAVASDFALPMLGSWSWIIQICVALSCIGSTNGVIFAASRVIYSASREGMLPEFLSMIHIRWLSPLPAAALLLPLCLMMLSGDNVYTLINYMSVSRWIFLAISVAVIPYYRWKYPDLHRPFKVPLIVPILFIFLSIFIVVMSFFKDPLACGIGLLISIIGIPLYIVCVVWFWREKPVWFLKLMGKVTLFMQKLMFVIHQEEEEKTFLIISDIK
ncbi:cystine/glutamate transporter-like isoform X2 [Amphiura filiformis]|uniref:cystine/glutamate transporter-like isoform X2 n=1 Tax=Amphiura filiformis TaxID=82378 RepID=UPI003B223A09